MLFARAMSNGARWYFPEIAFGAYTPEELGEDQIETQQVPQQDRNVIDVTPSKKEHPSEEEWWARSHRHLMAVANSVGIERDTIKTVADVSSLKEFDAEQLDQIRSEISAVGIAKELLEKTRGIEGLKSVWGKLIRSGLQRETGLFFSLIEEVKNQKKEQFNESPQE